MRVTLKPRVCCGAGAELVPGPATQHLPRTATRELTASLVSSPLASSLFNLV